MRIAIFGLGFVGTVTGACFAIQGHKVVGVDINMEKVKAVNQGKSPIIERELDQRSLRRIERERRAEEDRLGLK